MLDILLKDNLIVFFVSILISSLFIFPINKLGLKYGIIDKQDNRKNHKGKIVRIGGLSIIFGSYFALLITSYFLNYQIDDQLLVIIFASFLFFIIGFCDDLLSVGPITRLIFQVISTLVALKIIDNLEFPIFKYIVSSNTYYLLFLVASLIVSIFWVTGVTNALNWTDGLDGLAGGVSLIILSGLFFIFLSLGLNNYALYSITIAGGCYGFLIHNTKPASIHMGDGGSYFLGFNLATLSLIASNNLFIESNLNNSLFTSFFPILILSVPIFDMVFVILLRLLNYKSPFYPDRNHLHHRLLSLGFSYQNTILIILILNIILVSFVYFMYSRGEFIIISLTFNILIILSLELLNNIFPQKK